MITIYQVIQVVFWFYYLSITLASVVVCMHANWSWSQVLHISYLGIDTATQRRVLLLHIVMPNPFVSCIPCPICVPSRYNSGVNFWSKTVWSWTNGNMGKATCQQCPNNMLLDNSERIYLLINCRFIRGQRVGHWPLTVNSCNELCPWFFVFGHTNYARWLPVFLKDMAKLPEVHPAVHDAFMEGMCVIQRGDKKCYCVPIWSVHTYATDALLAKLYDGKYELFRFISKELQRDTADLHYELLTTNADLACTQQ